MGLASDTLLLWELVPVATVAAWAALLVELSAMGVFAMTFLLTNRSPVLSWSRWRDALGATALAWVVLGEAVPTHAFLGAAVVMAGVLVATRKR